MKKDFFTVFRFSWLLLVAVLALPFVSYAQGPRTLVCNDNVQISITDVGSAAPNDCGGVVPDHFLEAPRNGEYFLEIGDVVYRAGSSNSFFYRWSYADNFWELDANGYVIMDFQRFNMQTVNYKIIFGGNSCWGTATFELNVIPELDLGCPYIPALHQTETVTVTTAAPKVFDVDIVPMGCQVGAVTVSDAGGAKYRCDDGDDGIAGTIDDGWCNASCLATYDAATNKVTVTAVPGPNNVATTIPAGVAVECTVVVKAPECIECVTWCPGDGVDAEDIRDALSGTCFANPKDVFVKETNHGDQCTGLTTVRRYSAIVTQHGQDVLVDIGTQAFTVEPISIFKDDGAGNLVLNLFEGGAAFDPATGSGVLCLPPTNVSLNCDQDPDNLALTGQPMIANHHETSVSYKCTKPLTVHYKEVTGILRDQPVQVGDDWIIVDVLEKEFREVSVCDCADITPILDRFVRDHAEVGDVVEIVGLDWATLTSNLPGIYWSTDAKAWVCVDNNRTDTGLHDTPVDGTYTLSVLPYKKYTLDQLAAYACNTILYTRQDVGEFPACGSGRKFLRNWTLIDWCEGERAEFTQVIEVKDTKAPTLTVDPADFEKETVSTQPWICTGAIETDGSQYFTDECSDYRVEVEVTEATTGIWVDPSAVGAGHYLVSYVAIDDCGNQTKPIYREFEVVDNVKPVPVCEDELVVSVTPDNSADGDGGLAKILAEDFNAGSHDAGCGPIDRIRVVRMEDWNVAPESCDPFTRIVEEEVIIDKFGTTETVTSEIGIMGDYVKFCCDDVDQENIVVMRVWDAAGNFNDCMVRVTVQNKLGASLSCIDHELSCLEFSGNHEDYAGFDTAGSKCVSQDVTLFDLQESVNSCGIGSITRFYVLDGTNAICQSTIKLTGAGAFNPYSIRWPFHYTETEYTAVRKEIDTREGSDTEGYCIENGTEEGVSNGVLTCGDDQPTCEPTWTDAACGLVGVSMTPEVIEFDENACYKIINRWTVVDWCLWEANDGSENLDDENDTSRDTFEACANWCEEDCNRYFFRYSAVDVDGYYTFDQVIKVVDEVAPTASCTVTASALGADCTGSISFSVDATDGADCPSSTLTYYWSANGESGTGASGTMDGLTAGTYTVTFTVTDGCGNSTTTSCEATIADEKAPTPICYQSISTAIMAGDSPSVEIWASDYIKEGSDNCPGDLTASFSGTEAEPNRTFTCDDVTGGDMEMQVWLWDAAGNADYCYVTIRIDDNGHCTGMGNAAMIAGNIATEYGDDVAEADVQLNSLHPEYPAMRTTANDGHYAFGGTPLTYDYEISAERNDDYMNGVSTLDLVLIQKHILGLATLDSPYKVIAADINSDQRVTAADLVQLRQLILGVTDALPSNDSWRFVDAGQAFNSTTSPWPFTEVIDVTALTNNMMSEDFVGVKIGDVNANAQANSLMSAEVRSNGTLNLNIVDAEVNAGDLVSVNVSAENFSEVFGYQLTMNHAGLTLTSVEAGELEITDDNIGVREGVLTMSWNNTNGVTTSGTLFTLNFTANDNLQLSDVIAINSRITNAEAYVGTELANNDIALTFTNGENTIVAAEYDLYQNEPNPFRAYTDVSFVLPNSGQATISVIDVTGKLVRQVKDQFNKGLNTVRFTKSDLGAASGILYYKLESGEFTATKKMIVIE